MRVVLGFDKREKSNQITKEKDMGLDQYAGLRDSNGEVHDEFYWRKHAKLQQFFAYEFDRQKPNAEHNSMIQSLGFNGGQGGVEITEEVVKRLEEQYQKGYADCKANDGFFWGQQWQDEAVQEYKAQDRDFIEWCKKQLQEGRKIAYDCSW